MKFSKDKELMAKHGFASITRIKNFRTIDYAGHVSDRCSCGRFKFEFSTESNLSQKMDKYLKVSKIEVLEKTQKDNEIIYSVAINKIKIKTCLDTLYRKSFPKIKPIGDKFYKRHSPFIKIFLYKTADEKKLKYKIIEKKDLCKFIKNNSDIERALYLLTQSTLCYVEGIGCSCSQIEPLSPNEFNANDIIKIFNEIEIKQRLQWCYSE